MATGPRHDAPRGATAAGAAGAPAPPRPGGAHDAHANGAHDAHANGAHGHAAHGDHPADSPTWVLAPLVVGLVIGAVILILLGLNSQASPF